MLNSLHGIVDAFTITTKALGDLSQAKAANHQLTNRKLKIAHNFTDILIESTIVHLC